MTARQFERLYGAGAGVGNTAESARATGSTSTAGRLPAGSPRGPQRVLERKGTTSWHAASFMIEVLVLLVIFATAVAVFTVLFGEALRVSNHTTVEVEAISVAQRTAEEFAADPAGITTDAIETTAHTGGEALVVSIDRTSKPHERGTMWYATITVDDTDGNELYTLNTMRYVADAAAEAEAEAEVNAAADASAQAGDAS